MSKSYIKKNELEDGLGCYDDGVKSAANSVCLFVKDFHARPLPLKIRCHSTASTDDIKEYFRPTARKKPDMIIIHTGTNDI